MLLTAITGVSEAQMMHYDRPATFFEEALPIGNGRLGAMVYGGVDTLRLSLNDLTLWTGEPDCQPVNPTAYTHLPAVREALFSEDYAAADTLVMALQGKETEKYQPLGTLYIAFLGDNTPVSHYQRALDLSTATVTSDYSIGSSTIHTESFASSPDSVIVVHLTTDAAEGLSLRVSLTSLLPHDTSVTSSQIVSTGYAAYAANAYYLTGEHGEQLFYDPDRGIHYCTIVSVDSAPGTVTADDSSLIISGSPEVTLYIVNATSFNGADKDPVRQGIDYCSEATRNITRAVSKGFSALQATQQDDYKSLYETVQLSLGTTPDSLSQLPTDEQLRRYTLYHEANPELEAMYFQYGRYLLISSSRTPGVPANLQGLWNESLSPPWRSNYTININLEENYWPVETTHLAPLHLPLIAFLREMCRTGQQSAKAYYNISRGWCAGHNSDIWATTNPIGEGVANPQWANWTMGGAWLATHIYEHYTFSQDTLFLREYYPVLRDAAMFCCDWLIDKDGELITAPSTSPENEYVTAAGYHGNTFYGGTADIAIIRECLADAIVAAEVLHTDSLFCEEAQATIARLRQYHIGSRGQLLEWYHDWSDADWTHRHQSHLYGLYPGHHLTVDSTPELCTAAATALAIKGDHTTGWSTGWRANLYARLRMPDEAYNMLRTLLSYVSPEGYTGADRVWGGGTYPNLFDAHPPFQIDGNFGGTAAIAEMLVQSTIDSITILPACSAAWRSGQVSGLCVRGGGEVAFTWHDGVVTALTLTSHATMTTTVYVNGSAIPVTLGPEQTITII